MKTKAVNLSKEDAKTVFGVTECCPIANLRHWQSIFNNDYYPGLYAEIRFMMLILKTYLNYKSDDVRYIIQNMINKLIDDIYKSEEEEIDLASFKFLYPIIWQHRNFNTYKVLKKHVYKKELIETVRQHLLELGAIQAYQKDLY